MARASVAPGSSRAQTTDATPRVSDETHTGTDLPPVPGEVPLGTVDILGDFGDDSDNPDAKAADALELDQLRELACPAGDLADAALKVAWLARMDFYGRDESGYGSATTLLLGSLLSDLVLLRQAEVTRRDILAKAAGR